MTSERMSACMLEIRALHDVIDKFKLINVDPTEYTCLKAIVIFKTGTNIANTKWIPFQGGGNWQMQFSVETCCEIDSVKLV